MMMKLDKIIYMSLFLFIGSIVYGHPTRPFGDPIQFTSCNFETGICSGYEHDLRCPFAWSVNNKTTASPDTGPTGDNTPGLNGNGNYLYIESSKKMNGEKARFQTHTLEQQTSAASTSLCLTFHYHMYGHTMGDLKVIIQQVPTGREKVVFHLSGNQGTQRWTGASVQIPLQRNPFKIVFEGSTSFSFFGDMAIDDIKISNMSNCPFYPPHAIPKKPTTRPSNMPPLPGPENKNTCGKRAPHYDDLIKASNVARLLGGTSAEYGAWPWMAMLQKFDKKAGKYELICGGTLLGTQWVVTAAHCVSGYRNKAELQVRLGAHERMRASTYSQDMKIENIYLHERYRTDREYNFDIALVKLARPACITEHVNSICLHDDNWDIEVGETCVVLGWGKLWNDGNDDSAPYSFLLQEGEIPIRSHRNCTKAYGEQVTKNMICAGKTGGSPDTCLGDSGGPLLCKNNGQWQLVGVTSWGHKDACGLYGKYGVYTKVENVRQWIRSVIMDTSRHRPLHFNVMLS